DSPSVSVPFVEIHRPLRSLRRKIRRFIIDPQHSSSLLHQIALRPLTGAPPPISKSDDVSKGGMSDLSLIRCILPSHRHTRQIRFGPSPSLASLLHLCNPSSFFPEATRS